MNIFYILGLAGAFLILLGFLLRSNKKYGVGTKAYDYINLLGAVFLIIYSVEGRMWPFVILNTVWAGDSLKQLTISNEQ